ncbi:MAG: homoserine dehydrogenase [Thermodesulfobacteriota bacterium]
MKTIHIGMIGFGTVGSGTAQVLLEQSKRITRRTGVQICLKTVLVRSPRQLPEEFADITVTCEPDDLFNDPDIDIIVELIGGIEPARTYALKAIEKGKHVVTANKALLSECGIEIFQAAAKNNVEVGFEGSVAGGIPVVKTIKEGLAANRIVSLMGILNGTANYILTQMTDHGLPFAEVLKDAQGKGYAEADPTFDIEGIDTAHKLAILVTMAYGIKVNLDDIAVEGISRIEPIDINLAHEFGYRIKLLAISCNHGDHVELRVHPTLVAESHLLASINGAFNSVHIQGDMVGDILLYGPGAGKLATGSAVAADIVDISRNIVHGAINRVSCLSYLPEHIESRKVTPISQLRCPYYFRFTTLDQPGVLATIAGILGKFNISIESVIQKSNHKSKTVPIVMRTYEAVEASVVEALAEIDKLPMVAAETVKIRILAQGDED